ncbi:MAG TPA: protein kinase, partial [Planctomycetota bacterium]|nr:protein kinase [Planctomycetota bacterium]
MTLPPSSTSAPAESQDFTDAPATINERYRVVRCLGRGGMGMVSLVEDSLDHDRLLALKSIRRDRLDTRTLATLRNEFLSLSALPHPSLVRVFDFGIDRGTGDTFFTYEFVNGESWLKAVQHLDLGVRPQLEEFIEILAQVLRGLEFIHCRGLVHG